MEIKIHPLSRCQMLWKFVSAIGDTFPTLWISLELLIYNSVSSVAPRGWSYYTVQFLGFGGFSSYLFMFIFPCLIIRISQKSLSRLSISSTSLLSFDTLASLSWAPVSHYCLFLAASFFPFTFLLLPSHLYHWRELVIIKFDLSVCVIDYKANTIENQMRSQ